MLKGMLNFVIFLCNLLENMVKYMSVGCIPASNVFHGG